MLNNNPKITYHKLNINHIKQILTIEEELYIGGLKEDKKTVLEALNSSKINWGAFDKDILVGFVLGLQEEVGSIWLYDLSVTTKYQHIGIGRALYELFLTDCQKMNLVVNTYCRKTSVKLITDTKILTKHGYKIIKNRFEPDGYYQMCGVHEDGYSISLSLT